MNRATATNLTTNTERRTAQPRITGTAINQHIPVGEMEAWRRDALKKVLKFKALANNWDGRGSAAPCRAATQAAIEVLQGASTSIPPSIVPVSNGGIHFEWSAGSRELEFSVRPSGHVVPLKVENGMPIEDETDDDLYSLFVWLQSA